MNKYILTGVTALALAAVFVFGFKWYDSTQENQTLRESYTALASEADLDKGRAKTEIGVLKNKNKLLSADIQKEIKARKAKETLYANVVAELKAKGKGKLIIRKVPVEKIVIVKQDGTVEPITSLPFTYKDFRIDIKGDVVKKEFEYDLHQQFEVQLLETKDKHNVVNHYAELHELNRLTGKRVGQLKLTKFQVTTEPPKGEVVQFNWWDPKFTLGLYYQSSLKFDKRSIVFDAGVSAMSYGKKNHPYLRVMRLGISTYVGDPVITFSPVQLNIAERLPLFSNIWFTPNLGYRLSSDPAWLIQLGVGVTI